MGNDQAADSASSGRESAGLGEPTPFGRYYAALHETDRLTRTAVGRLEFERTRELLEPELPAPPAEVLDVGEGTGIYAAWLAASGYDVHLVDPVEAHVAAAARQPGVTATVGDARKLQRRSASADVVLLLGPLYHLSKRADRVAALTEAMWVVKPGGLVAAAAIARHASLLDFAGRGLLTPQRLASITTTLATGVHDPALGFTDAWFHRVEDLEPELHDAGLVDATVYGIEGPAYLVLKTAEAVGDVTPPLFDSCLNLARAVQTDPAMLATGSHLLAIARRPG